MNFRNSGNLPCRYAAIFLLTLLKVQKTGAKSASRKNSILLHCTKF